MDDWKITLDTPQGTLSMSMADGVVKARGLDVLTDTFRMMAGLALPPERRTVDDDLVAPGPAGPEWRLEKGRKHNQRVNTENMGTTPATACSLEPRHPDLPPWETN